MTENCIVRSVAGKRCAPIGPYRPISRMNYLPIDLLSVFVLLATLLQ